MKKMKRMIALLLTLVMAASLLSGCRSKAGGNEGKPVNLTIYSQTANYSGEMVGWFAQVLKEKFNVVINLIPDADGVYETRMEAGNLGDIVILSSSSDYLNAVDAGLLYDWEEDDLIGEYGPYIKENMSAALENNKELSKGTLYGFGHDVATSSEDRQAFFYTWDIRWDLYKQLGCPEIKNLDDYLKLLEDMKGICPTDDNGNPTYAVSLWPDWDETMVMYVKAAATAYFGYDEQGMGHYDTLTGAYYPALEENSPYLEMLRFFNSLYRKKLLDPDSMTQTYDEMIAKVQNGGTFFSIFNYSGWIGYNTDAHVESNKMMCSLTPEEATPIAYGMNIYGSSRIWTIGAKTQYPELCMEILDWLCTPEGRMTSEYGPQGVCWDYDEEGYTYFTELGRACRNDANTEMKDGYIGKFQDGGNKIGNTTWSIDASNPDSNGESYNSEYWKSMQEPPRCETEAEWREFTGADNVQQYMSERPHRLALGTKYSESNKSPEFKVVWEQVIKAICDYSWRAIYAKTPEDYNKIVAEMVEITKGYGYDQCIEWSRAEAARRLECENAVRGN